MEEKQTLALVIKESSLAPAESQSLLEKFGNYEQIAQEWDTKAHAIVVSSITQTTEMAMAKEARKKFSRLRLDVEEARVAMKEQALRKGQAIDAIAKYLVSLIKPIEDYLKEQEDFSKIWAEKKLIEQREIEAKRIEEERIAKEKADEEERERVRIENEKMRKELEEKEKVRLELEEKNRKEKEEADRKLAEERAAAQKILDNQRAAAEKERMEAQKKLDEERLRAEKERLEAQRIVDAEKAEAQKKLDEEKKKAEDARLLAEKEKRELEEKLASMIECPNCHHKFNI